MRIKTIFSIMLLVAVLFAVGSCAQPAAPEPVVVTVEVPGETVVETVVVEVPAAEEPAAEEPAEPEEAGPLGPVTIQFTGWTYDLEKVMDNTEQYKEWVSTEADPPIEVEIEWTDSGYGEFDTHVTTAYAAGNSFDVLYSSDHWLAKWAEAGWVVPLEDYYPEVLDYKADIAPFSWDAMTYNGKVYGLPYYTDVMYFFYNQAMLEEAGISSPPTTWAEVTEQGKILKEQGVTSDPFMVGLQAGSWFDEGFFALIYSEGASMFDENLEPVFETNQGPVYDMIEYVAAAINDEGIMPLKVLEMTAVDVQEAFKAGDTAFAIVPGYMVREFNTPGISQVAGQAEVSMMPGATHETDGYSRMYLMGSGALEDEVVQEASWHLIEFLGGETSVGGETDYHVAKRWAVANGLGFSVDSLWEDPAVDKAFSAMADTATMQKQKNLARSKEGISAPWFAEWISFVRTEVQKAFLRQATTEEVLESIKQQWLDLKAEAG
jgi:multiple sugar transport system substrate-binding protein